ncbi:MAG: hypothetical protein WA948_07375 [Pontixanthobacter sp.]
MIGKIIGAFAGNQIAKSTRGGVGGPAGAALGFAAPMILRRISLPTLALLGAGGYFAKKFFDEKDGTSKKALKLTSTTSAPDTYEQPVVGTGTPGTPGTPGLK